MKHLDEATIQAFLDGELNPSHGARISSHLSLCQKCTQFVIEAESEMADINLAFANENSSPVPTQRIWARIENELDYLEIQPQTAKPETSISIWQTLAALLTPSQIAFAGGLAAIVLVALFGLTVIRRETAPNENLIATKTPTPAIQISNGDTNERILPTTNKPIQPADSNDAPKFVKVSAAQNVPKPKLETSLNLKSKIQNPKSDVILPEEKNYLNSIQQLSKAVNTGDEFVMRPSFRVEYERNLAMMDSAISQMQKQARRNPKDENARRILFASYQNKIELLNTVAEKSQLMVSMR